MNLIKIIVIICKKNSKKITKIHTLYINMIANNEYDFWLSLENCLY